MNEANMSILWLRSLRTGRRFPAVLFSGDTDMATNGLFSLSSISGAEVVVTELFGEDYTASTPSLEARFNARLGRSDLRHVSIVRVVRHTVEPSPGLTFREVLASLRPSEVFYCDIFDAEGEGEAVVEREESMEQFRASGGVVTQVP